MVKLKIDILRVFIDGQSISKAKYENHLTSFFIFVSVVDFNFFIRTTTISMFHVCLAQHLSTHNFFMIFLIKKKLQIFKFYFFVCCLFIQETVETVIRPSH